MMGKCVSAKEMSSHINAVTASDLKNVLRKMISRKPTFILVGDPKHLPDLEQYYHRFGIGGKNE